MRTHTRRSADQWQALINEQQQSPLSAPQFCKQHDLGYASFCNWRKRLSTLPANESARQAPDFLAIEPTTEPSEQPHWIVELQLNTDVVLRVGKL